ncbi:hypothetical protein FT637_09210 [Bacillus cereus]|uniref:hypothetical protein n=1 Tax=Bacillus cereus TaxID=1396 RepID=UPI00187A4F6F|nr:hypothetical protein [Bacillus cereus]MBE7103227.1 hypothetical protein [Bacillus cereus]
MRLVGSPRIVVATVLMSGSHVVEIWSSSKVVGEAVIQVFRWCLFTFWREDFSDSRSNDLK